MDFGKRLHKYKKPKNRLYTLISLSCTLIILYNFTIKNSPFAISDSTITYLTLFFIAMISQYLINSSDDNENNHDEIKSIFNKLQEDRNSKCNEIKSIFNKQQEDRNNKCNEIKSVINKQYPYVLFAKEVKNSDFEFIKMANRATKSIFVIGPNLNFIANEERDELKQLLYNKMEKDENFKVLMLLSNPAYDQICDSMSKNTFTENFVFELNKAIQNLSIWKKEMKNTRVKSQLLIRKTSIVTLSLTFIDADSEYPNRACVLVTPIPPNVPGHARPCFLIEKQQHEEAFNKYYVAYHTLFVSNKVEDVE